MGDIDAGWYVVAAHREFRVRDDLVKSGIETWLPECRVRKTLRRTILTETGALFPGYLFVRVAMTREIQRAIEETRWVDGILKRGERPANVDSREFDELRTLVAEHGGRVLIVEGRVSRGYDTPPDEAKYKPGQPVRVREGPFTSFNGLYDAPDGSERVKILLDIFGRITEISLPEASVEAAA